MYFRSQRTEKYELLSQGTYNFQKLKNKTLAIPDQERVNNSKFADLGMDHRLNKNDNFHSDRLWYYSNIFI